MKVYKCWENIRPFSLHWDIIITTETHGVDTTHTFQTQQSQSNYKSNSKSEINLNSFIKTKLFSPRSINHMKLISSQCSLLVSLESFFILAGDMKEKENLETEHSQLNTRSDSIYQTIILVLSYLSKWKRCKLESILFHFWGTPIDKHTIPSVKWIFKSKTKLS